MSDISNMERCRVIKMERISKVTAEVTVSPRGHLMVDDELHIRVQGLASGQHVTIHTGINVSGKTMESCCQFRADENGVVDLYNHPSLAGSYTGQGPFTAVIDLFGMVGGLVEFRSALLASRGIASLALAYFLYEGLPNTVLDVELDYFLEAVQWLLEHPKIQREGLGVVGVSKGGDIGLMMAATCPKISACVSINGCTFNANGPMKFSGGEIPGIIPDLGKMTRRGDGIWSSEKVYEYDETDLIPAWRHNPNILNILSEDDAVSPLDSIYLMKKHYPRDKVDNFTILSYPGAGHLLEPPYTPLCNMSYHRSMGHYIWWGGQHRQHADAQEDAWRQLLTFLHKHLPKANLSQSKL